MSTNTDEELHRMVKGIVDDLEAAVAGNLYRVDGDCRVIEDLDEWKDEQYKKLLDEFREKHPRESFDPEETGFDTYEEWAEDEVGAADDDVDEPDEVSLSEYIEEQSLGDVRFEVDSDLDLNGGKVLFVYGGPNIWVADDEVRGYWGASTVEMSLDSQTRSALYDWFDDLWTAKKEARL